MPAIPPPSAKHYVVEPGCPLRQASIGLKLELVRHSTRTSDHPIDLERDLDSDYLNDDVRATPSEVSRGDALAEGGKPKYYIRRPET